MAVRIGDSDLSATLNRYLEKAQEAERNAVGKLATGSNFGGSEKHPAEQALSDKMEYRLRSLSAAKQNINSATSLLQTVDASMAEIGNILTRMKEINLTAASATLGNQERKYLLVEYEALRNEMDRISKTTEFNGLPLLHGSSEKVPENLFFRVDDPFIVGGFFSKQDLNAIQFNGLKFINTTPDALGLRSARSLLLHVGEDGIQMEDVEELMTPENKDQFATIYDQALASLSEDRALYGALQARLGHSMTHLEVYQENIAAAKSKIADTDYSEEISKMLHAKISTQATTALLVQSHFQSEQTLQLLRNLGQKI
jgi:flagellin